MVISVVNEGADTLRELLYVAGIVSCTVLGACSWNRSADMESRVRFVTDKEIDGCRKVGVTHVSVVDRLETLDQVEGGVAAELKALARNSAVQLGGNAVVQMSEINQGSQTFAVFSCQPVK